MTKVVECVREFLDLLRDEEEETYAKISLIGKGMHLGLRYGPDYFSLKFPGQEIVVERENALQPRFNVWCSVEPETFFSMLDGKTALSEMVWSNSLEIRGKEEEVLRAYQIVELALKASRSSPAFLKVLSKLRDSSRQELRN